MSSSSLSKLVFSHVFRKRVHTLVWRIFLPLKPNELTQQQKGSQSCHKTHRARWRRLVNSVKLTEWDRHCWRRLLKKERKKVTRWLSVSVVSVRCEKVNESVVKRTTSRQMDGKRKRLENGIRMVSRQIWVPKKEGCAVFLLDGVFFERTDQMMKFTVQHISPWLIGKRFRLLWRFFFFGVGRSGVDCGHGPDRGHGRTSHAGARFTVRIHVGLWERRCLPVVRRKGQQPRN